MLGFWETGLHRNFGAALPTEARPLIDTIEAILGGTIVGEALAAWFLARYPLREGQRWAWEALWLGHRIWFGVAFIACLMTGAQDTLLTLAMPAFLVFAVILWRAKPPPAVGSEQDSVTTERELRYTRWFCMGQVIFGCSLVLVAWGLDSSPYHRAMWAALWPEGGASSLAQSWLVLGFGLIGALFAAHFSYLAMWAHHSPSHPRLARAYVASVFAWFMVDSVGCALAGAWFNVLSINIMCIVGAASCWWLDHRA